MASTQPRSLKVGVLAAISEIDPRKAVDYVSGLVLDQVFESPYAAVAGQATAEARLFEPLRSEDGNKGRQYSAAIRPGIFFSDGTPLTPELAARSLRGSSVLADKATVDVRGDRVWFTLAASNPRFELTLTQGGCAIVFDQGQQLFGTGPYMFAERPNVRQLQLATRVQLVRNPHHRAKAGVDEIEFHVLLPENDGTPRALVEALRSGSVDLTTALSAADLVTWKIDRVAPLTKPSSSTGFLYLNTARRPLDDARARRGIAATIDRFEVSAKSYERNPAAFVATAALPPSMRNGSGMIPMQSDDGAQLIRESGLAGARLTLLVPWAPRPYLPKPLIVAQVIQQRLADAGVTISLLETKNADDYFNALNDGRFDLALGGWIADTADPADFFDALLSSHAVGNINFANHSRWSDAATDKLLEQFRAGSTEAHRAEIERIIAEEVPLVPLVYGQSCVAHGRHVRNVTLEPTGSLSLATFTVT
jgi:ABC-type transport system substrate-binding protein